MSAAPSTPATLNAPLYGAGFGQAISRFFSKYATFHGRASRSEYWWATLFLVLVGAVFATLALVFGTQGATPTETGGSVPGPGFAVVYGIYGLWGLAVLVPSLAITWRRLHDTGRSGGFYFIGLIPLVGSIILLVFLLLPSEPSGARFDR